MTNTFRILLAGSLLTTCLILAPFGVHAQFGGGNVDRPIVAQFDRDKDGRLNTEERRAAQTFLETTGVGRGFGGRGGFRPPPSPGVRLTPADVKSFRGVPLYDAATLRTFFIEFENPGWEAEMVAFNNTDVDVPAKVTVDGKAYSDVGVHFRGNSSFGVGNGYKRSLNLAFDFVHEDQAIEGYRTLNFLNANADPSFMHTVLSLQIARQYIPAPRANFVRVVINGENWGVYASSQQFNKEFLNDNHKSTKGTRWKIAQNGRGMGGVVYVGDDPDSYRSTFNIKSKEDPAAWTALIKFAKTLAETPPDRLEAALRPMLDVDGFLKFLALDNVMASEDAFFERGSDYSLYLLPDGRFHLTFHDANETFNFGGRGGPDRSGPRVDPLVAQYDTGKPIISKILAVPALRAKYIGYVREIADKSMDWKTVGPVVKQYRALIADDVARDTRKLYTNDQFLQSTSDEPAPGSLRSFFDQRRAFLLSWTAQNSGGAQ